MKEADAYAEMLSQRAVQWQLLSERLKGRGKDRNVQQAREVLAGYRALAADLAMARRQLPGSVVHRTLEVLYAQTHAAIHHQRRRPIHELGLLYGQKVPLAVRALASEITLVTLLFIGAVAAGFLMVTQWRETADWFMSDTMMLMVQNRQLWTDDLLNVMPSSVLSLDLMTNNIAVALTAFALGLVYGLGTLYIISLNGLMLGAVFAYALQFSMAQPLLKFIVAHGIVELSVICLAGAAGLALGKGLARPGPQGRMASVREVAGHAGALAAVSVPFLIGSGLIEGYISPNDNFAMLPRVVIGVLWFVILVLSLVGVKRRYKLDPVVAA